MLNLVTKNPDIIRAKLIFAGDALPEQPFGSPRKCFRASQKHFGADLSLLERSRSVLESLWGHLGAILEPSWSHVGVSQAPQWPKVAFRASARAEF